MNNRAWFKEYAKQGSVPRNFPRPLAGSIMQSPAFLISFQWILRSLLKTEPASALTGESCLVRFLNLQIEYQSYQMIVTNDERNAEDQI
jgi:hypothetical protein